MKAMYDKASYSNENTSEMEKEMFEGFPVYPGSEFLYLREDSPSILYCFSKDNQILWTKVV